MMQVLPSTPLRLASYNIRKAVGLDRRRDPTRILNVIAGLNADIVALQEADRRLGQRVGVLTQDSIMRLTGMRPLLVAENDVSLGWHGNAILIRDHIQVHSVRRLILPGLEPRGAIRAELTTQHGPLIVIAAHLGLRKKDRLLQSHELLAAAQAENSFSAPVAILGDLNEWRKIGGLAPLHDALTLVSPGHSFHASRPIAPLDRFALNGLHIKDAGLSETNLARRASDHLPIWVDVHRA